MADAQFDKDTPLAVLQEAANKWIVEAELELAKRYDRGYGGCEKDAERAKEYLCFCAAGDANNPAVIEARQWCDSIGLAYPGRYNSDAEISSCD
jgi:hypothetical protein